MYYVLVAGSRVELKFPTIEEAMRFIEGAIDGGAEQVKIRYVGGAK